MLHVHEIERYFGKRLCSRNKGVLVESTIPVGYVLVSTLSFLILSLGKAGTCRHRLLHSLL